MFAQRSVKVTSAAAVTVAMAGLPWWLSHLAPLTEENAGFTGRRLKSLFIPEAFQLMHYSQVLNNPSSEGEGEKKICPGIPTSGVILVVDLVKGI